jgi:hypothetical protein
METRTVNPSWRKSSYSSGNGGQCVEAGHGAGAVLVRDTTDRDGVTLSVSLAAWASFTVSLK